jgi:excisionase family DNA binding protein
MNTSGTGKPPRKPSQKKPNIGPIDIHQRYSITEAAALLRASVPTVYKHIRAGRLETFTEGKRRYATGRGIAVLSLPPAERPQAVAA